MDPMNGKYYDEDEDELDKGHYHVEYLGKRRCHGWVLKQRVELFGEGNATITFENGQTSTSAAKNYKSKNSRNRRRAKFSCDKQCGKKEKRKYGGESVNEVIKAALQLLPHSHELRLKTCHFMEVDDGVKTSSTTSKMKQNNSSKAHKCAKESNYNICRRSKRFSAQKNETQVEQCSKVKRCSQMSDVNETDKDNFSQSQRGMLSFDFLTSLLDVTKEERLFLDIKTYKEKEHKFLDELGNFFSHCGLHSMIKSPVWHGSRVSLFDFFLAVHDRGGFKEVDSSGLWTSVFVEVTNFPSKGGGSQAKSFYKRFLYPFELYTKGEDYWIALKDLKNCNKKSTKSTFGQSFKTSESSIENEDLEKALDELDDLLQSLKEKDCVVPDLYEIKDNEHLQCCDSPILASWEAPIDQAKPTLLKPNTGSQKGLPAEPDEDAQVVPEMDFPSVSESSSTSEDGQSEREHDQNLPPPVYIEDDNGQEWILQELQALEYNF